MQRVVTIAALIHTATAAAAASYKDGRGFLSADMQPEAVAKTLARVEEEWKNTAWSYLECEQSESGDDAIRDCDSTPSSFSESCKTVVSAIVKGSSGDPKVMKEYMVDVCKQDNMGDWHQSGCITLAKDVSAKMSAYTYDNRLSFPLAEVCDNFWGNFLEQQKPLREKSQLVKKELMEQTVAAHAEEVRKAREHAKKAEADVEEALKGDVTKEEAELEAERQEVALRANRTVDRTLPRKEAEVEGVVEAAEKEIEEATAAEQDARDARQLVGKATTSKSLALE